MKEKTPLSHEVVCMFRWLISRPQVLNLRSRNQIRGKLLLSHNVLYHQPLPITRHQVRFYANNYFE